MVGVFFFIHIFYEYNKTKYKHKNSTLEVTDKKILILPYSST